MVVFSMAYNVGGTIREVCQGFSGVGVALLYNYGLFAFIEVERFDGKVDDPYKNYFRINKAFNSSGYWINVPNLYTTLPWIVVFTVVVMVLPFQTNTRKYALGTNAYFTLTIINPANPLSSGQLKRVDDELFDTSNILHNLRVFAIVGVIGALISVVTMCFPYPIFAISRLHEDSTKASADLLELLNIIVDAYCFKNKNVESMEFLKLRLKRKFDNAETRYRCMLSLLEDAWWEQCFGLHYPLHFNRVMSRTYIKLVGSLIADLRSLSYAMRLEEYGRLHTTYMEVLKREIYMIQTRSNDLLKEISDEVHALSPHLDLKTLGALENQVEMALYKFRKIQNRTLRKEAVTPAEVVGNVPLNLFLFSLNSFCSTLISFEHSHNSRTYNDVHRVRSFALKSLKKFVDPDYYKNLSMWINALKITMAIVAGVAFSVGVYGFSASVPSTIAYIMCETIGSSFRTTVNRVGGVVAGSVVPSVFKFFFVQICEPEFLGIALSNIVMFIWVGMCMYVYFGRGYGSYGGMVAAFVASDTLLRQTDICYPNGSDSSSSIAAASYSSLAQTSVAVVIFISVETFVFPKSAISMLRHKISDTLKLHHSVFDALFGHHLSSSVEMDEVTMDNVRRMLVVEIPKKLGKQQQLLLEAQVEPLLWRPDFSAEKYRRVLEISQRMLNTNYLLFKLLRWFHFRVLQNRVKLDAADIRDDLQGDIDNSVDSHTKWKISTTHFQSLVRDSFETLAMIFSDTFQYSDPDQTAVFMQMKEAFRLADKDCSGELNVDDVAIMLGTIFSQSGTVKEEDIQQYVQEFMDVVGKPGRTTVSFEDFMDALEHGLKLEVEVYRRMNPRAPALLASTLLTPIKSETQLEKALTKIQDNNDKLGECSKVDESRMANILTTSTISHGKDSNETSMLENASVFIRREYDVLNVDDFTTSEVVAHMKSAYVEWLLTDNRYERTSMEEQLLLNCLVSGAESIAKSLAGLEEIAMSS
ncbi:Transmembrane protein [Phytophthora palmivora]|uniref:Transmembrane protein n=1 Tax=Phytophthora palmivora TaxID=4796 RepID=A0A2P4YSL2_9STRA|nr:Transmembrane protein [Phytophthora palmivora]